MQPYSLESVTLLKILTLFSIEIEQLTSRKEHLTSVTKQSIPNAVVYCGSLIDFFEEFLFHIANLSCQKI